MKKKLTGLALALALALGLALPVTAEGGMAYASTQSVEVDGKRVEFQMYALKDAAGNPTNYVKLRDVAHVLNGTQAQFSVGWDGSISVTTGQPYADTGAEMTTPYSGDRAYQTGSGAVRVNGRNTSLESIILTDDAGGDYTYFKLRDLGSALGFTVDWSAERGVTVSTGSEPTEPEQPVDKPTETTKDVEVTTMTSQWGTGYYVKDNGFGTGKLNNGKPITEANVLELLAKAEKIWPTGMTFTYADTYNNHWYEWSGPVVDGTIGKYVNTNYGCGGFAAMVSDYVFGLESNPFHRVYDEKDLRPGDIVIELVDGKPEHVAFIAEANNGKTTIGNGNVNGLVKWNHGNLSSYSETIPLWNYLHPDQTLTYEFWSRYPE